MTSAASCNAEGGTSRLLFLGSLSLKGMIAANTSVDNFAMFTKPRHTHPTKYLFVGNCGTAVGLTEEAVEAFFDHLGAVDVIFPQERKSFSHIFVVFDDEGVAEGVLHSLDGKPCHGLGNRVLAAKYADLKEEKVG